MDIDWISERIGNTPLLDVTPDGLASHVFAKAEYYNLSGSVKDRAALSMIREGLRSGGLLGSKRILEATSGNTGIGLAIIGRLLGFPATLVMPSQVNRDRKDIIDSAGAESVFSDPAAGSNGALLKTLALFEESPERWFWPNQYYNPANYLAHEATAEEIFRQTEGRVTHFVAATGTGGTVVGVSKRLRQLKPDVQIVSVEPAEELHGIEGTKHMATESVPVILVQGRRLTGIFQAYRSSIDRTIFVSTDDAYAGINGLAGGGVFVGISSGANYVAACRVAEESPGSVVVTVFPDSSDRYLTEAPWDPEYYGVRMPYSVSQEMRRYFEQSYPHEGCGLLFGRVESRGRAVVSFEASENMNRHRAGDRYEIDPREMLRLEKKYRECSLKLLGIAHSHPDHPPRPSAFDLEVAWEDLSYMICSVIGGAVVSLKSWALDTSAGRIFREELIRLTGDKDT